jgi:hypothetical protein
MHAKRVVLGAALALLGLLGLSSTAGAVTINFAGSVTSCTPTCDSFAFLSTGSTLSGSVIFDDAALADGIWTGGDVLGLSFTVFDPAAPIFASDPPNPITDNPFTLDPSANGGGLVVANGVPITNPRGTWQACIPPADTSCVITSAGTYDGTSLDSGLMDIWLTQGVLAQNGAVVRLDFDTGTFAVNIFENLVFVAGGEFTNAAVPVPAALWLFGSAVLGLLSLRRRT